MFYFRINRLKIIDNREERKVLRVFGPDLAEVQIHSFVSTDDTQLPEMDELLYTNDPARRRTLIAAAVEHVVSSRVLTTIENVTDNHEMTFGDTGYVLHQSKRIPDQLDWILLAIESDRDVREIAQHMTSILDDDAFDSFIAQILSLAAAATNPSYVAAVGIGKFVAKTYAEKRGKKHDEMIGLMYTSLNRREHYPHGERKKNGVADLTNNMFINYSRFGCDPQIQPIPVTLLPPDIQLCRRGA